MGNDGVDDIFKDFEYKVAGKKEAPKSPFAPQMTPKKLSGDEELLEEKHRREQELLEEKYDKEKELLDEKRKEGSKRKKEAELRENILRQKSAPSKPANKSGVNAGKIGYLAVILVLVAYIVIDLSFYHGEKSIGEKNQSIASAVAPNATLEQNKSNESKEVKAAEEKKEEPAAPAAAEEKKLSGKVILKIDSIGTEVSKTINDTGYINTVTFTIDNGKDKILTPILDVYAYDSKLDVSWETKSRGQYKGIGIKPGDKYTGSISLTPRTFSDLKLERTVRLSLNDTKDGFITAVNEKALIS